jgi:hypothetical protein
MLPRIHLGFDATTVHLMHATPTEAARRTAAEVLPVPRVEKAHTAGGTDGFANARKHGSLVSRLQ